MSKYNNYTLMMIASSLLFSLILASAYAKQPREEYYTTGSLNNVRELPNSSSKLIVKLLINSFVYIDKEKGDWAHIKTNHRNLGWIHKSLLSKTQITIDSLLSKFNKTPESDVNLRIKLMERASSIEPTNIDILTKLEKSLSDGGKLEKAKSVNKYITSLNSQTIDFSAEKEKVIYYYDYGNIHPIISSSNSQYVDSFKIEHKADKFVLKHMSGGKRLLLTNRLGKQIGVVRIERGERPGYLGFGMCRDEYKGITIPIGMSDEESRQEGFATNFEVRPVSGDQQLKVDKDLEQKLNTYAINEYRNTKPKRPIGETGIDNPESSISLVEYISGDFDGDSTVDLVSAHVMYEHDRDTGYYVLLVNSNKLNHELRPIWSIYQGGSTSMMVRKVDILGKIDIDKNGADELIYTTDHYESKYYHIISFQNGKWKEVSVYAAGC